LAGCQQTTPVSQRPLIGITSVYRHDPKINVQPENAVPMTYIYAVRESGGVPVILPTVTDDNLIGRYLHMLDGLVLIGGLDIPPKAYGEEPHKTVEAMPPERFNFESRLIRQWYDSGKPMLGVCLGMQFTNVMRGGTLIQDIPSQVGETVTHRGDQAHHKVIIEKDSRLYRILGTTEAVVYSSHHQAVKEVGEGLKISARSIDGVVEALERPDGRFGLFVQWHPEAMDDVKHRKAIYSALIHACVAGK
jgi:putative glutamine amidotransferase